MTFKQLSIGETFAFQPCRVSQNRVLHCWKISPRCYGVAFYDGSATVRHITHWYTPVYQEGLTGAVYA
jgi:hypothetical protein